MATETPAPGPDGSPEPLLPLSMQTRMMPLGEVKRYWNNPRKKQNVQKLARSLETFGWRQPIVVDGSFVIIVGDTRYLGAEALGMSHVPVWIAADLTPEQVHAYRIADNRLAEESDWNDDLLREELELLTRLGVDDLTVTGFDESELAKILAVDDDQAGLEPVDVAQFPPHTWVLIGIPTNRYIEIAEHVEAIGLTTEVFVEVTANDQKAPRR